MGNTWNERVDDEGLTWNDYKKIGLTLEIFAMKWDLLQKDWFYTGNIYNEMVLLKKKKSYVKWRTMPRNYWYILANYAQY